jgi:hypothetical protein
MFSRAKNIRIRGESWQNCLQRAKAQINYERQLGGQRGGENGFGVHGKVNSVEDCRFVTGLGDYNDKYDVESAKSYENKCINKNWERGQALKSEYVEGRCRVNNKKNCVKDNNYKGEHDRPAYFPHQAAQWGREEAARQYQQYAEERAKMNQKELKAHNRFLALARKRARGKMLQNQYQDVSNNRMVRPRLNVPKINKDAPKTFNVRSHNYGFARTPEEEKARTFRGGYFSTSQDTMSATSDTRTSDFTNVTDTTSYTLTGGGSDSSYSYRGGSGNMSYTTNDDYSVSSVW